MREPDVLDREHAPLARATNSERLEVSGRPLRIAYLVTEDWYFCSHRLPIARAARAAGAEVTVITRVAAHRETMEREGFRVVTLPWSRRTRRVADEVAALRAIIDVYRTQRPDIVHHVALKPAVYGGLAAIVARVPIRIAAVAGLGYTTVSRSLRARALRRVLRGLLHVVWSGGRTHAIVQNADDAEAIGGVLLPRAHVHVIRGSGVDTDHYRAQPQPEGRVVAAYVGRLIASKGIRELSDAARRLHERAAPVDVLLVGDPDRGNPEAVAEKDLMRWEGLGWLRREPWTDDVVSVWKRAHIAVLPSYREGLPKALLEAAASERAIVACDVPGSRDVVSDGETGLLVPARDGAALADAIDRLARDAGLRARMGRAGRERVAARFSEPIIVSATIELYRELVGGA